MDRRGFFKQVAVGTVLSVAAGELRGEPHSDTAVNVAESPESEKLRNDLDIIRSRLELPAIGGIAVSRDGTIAQAAAGVRKMGESAPVSQDAHWQLGSITKTFTATLTAMMVDRGKTTWDATLESIYPEHVRVMAPDVRDITIRQIVRHRSGMEGDVFGWEGTPEMNAPKLTLSERRQRGVVLSLKAPLAFPPGSKYAYSNRAYNVLGAALERIAGKSWEDLILTEIAKPLGMKSPMFGEPALVDPREPWPHELNGKQLKAVAPVPRSSYGYFVCNCAGGVTLTLADFGLWMRAHLNGEANGGILSREMFKTIHTPEEQGGMPAFGFGHAWPALGRTLQHNGSNGRNYAFHAILPDRGVGVLMAVNAVPPEHVPADFKVYNTLLATALPGKWPRPALRAARLDGEGVVEGESLEVVKLSGGNVEFQNFQKCSRGFQLFWSGAKDGSKLTLGVDVPEAGEYAVEGVFANNSDFGEVTMELGTLKRRLDFRAETLDWKQAMIGSATLAKGPQKIVVTSHGNAGEGKLFCHLGLDKLQLRAV